MLVQKSPDSQDKPFACDEKGCDMSFTNKDHLEWHHKKHEMMLNLGLVNKSNEVADQTPTPTRFIRNCEEVGLFQDLQNVNPFDELFKKAAELAKNGVTIDVQSNHSDDTLHTPHILPHITENQLKQSCLNSKNDSDCEFDFPTSNSDYLNSNSVICLEDEEDKAIKKKIKENLLNKKPPVITVVPFQDLTETKNRSKENNSKPDNRIEQIREMNRAAQLRCRRKKQQVWRDMEQQIETLKEENKRLRLELEALRTLHSKCLQSPTNNGSLVTPVISSVSSQVPNITSSASVPLIIQVIPNAQISLLPTERDAQEKTDAEILEEMISGKVNVKKKPFRKLVPRIDIKKS